MREIKFRLWNKINNKMYSMEQISFMDITNGTFDDIDVGVNSLEKDEYILLQYTGLKDENEVEIYEGDILEWYILGDRCIAEIKYISERGYISHNILNHYIIDPIDYKLCKIIGNIYENKELLKGNN